MSFLKENNWITANHGKTKGQKRPVASQSNQALTQHFEHNPNPSLIAIRTTRPIELPTRSRVLISDGASFRAYVRKTCALGDLIALRRHAHQDIEMSGAELKTDANQRWMMYTKDAYEGGRIFLTAEQKQAVDNIAPASRGIQCVGHRSGQRATRGPRWPTPSRDDE